MTVRHALALDLGTKCGYAVKTGAASIVHGTLDLAPKRHEGGGMRYLRFRRWLDEVQESSPLGLEWVGYEEVRRHVGTTAAHVYGGLQATLQEWCEDRGVPYRSVPVADIKRYATGKGNASKDDVIAAVREWGYEPEDDNAADAVALLRLLLRHF